MLMKKLVFIFLLFLSFVSVAQPLRVFLAGGFSNYSGDIQKKQFTLSGVHGALSVGATYNIIGKLALRASYSYTNVGADDKNSADKNFLARNLNFQTALHEAAMMLEYDILNLNEFPVSPFVFAGTGVYKFNPYTYNSNREKVFLEPLSTEGQGLEEYPDRKRYKLLQLSLPVGGGLKYALSDDVHIGVEMGFRKLFTDFLDDLSTTYVDQDVLLRRRGQQAVDLAFRGDELKNSTRQYPPHNTTRGNKKSNDGYYFGLVRLSFRMNWFDNTYGNSNRSNSRKLGCPSWR